MPHDGGVRSPGLPHFFHPIERPAKIALEYLLPKIDSALEIGSRESIYSPTAQILAAYRLNEFVHVLARHFIHARELSHSIHERSRGEAPRKNLFSHRGAHLFEQSQSHTHPGRTALELKRDLHRTQSVLFVELRYKLSLLNQMQTKVVSSPD